MQSDKLDRIVVWDPKGEYWDGSLVSRAAAPRLASRGAVLLPCDPTSFKRGGSAGYVRRAWGSGYPLDQGVPRLHAPISMLAFVEQKYVHWAARLASNEDFDAKLAAGVRPSGTLRFSGDGSREHSLHINVVQETPAIDVRELPPKDVHGGWTITGRGGLRLAMDGHYSFALYGMGPGLRIVWLAATLTETNS